MICSWLMICSWSSGICQPFPGLGQKRPCSYSPKEQLLEVIHILWSCMLQWLWIFALYAVHWKGSLRFTPPIGFRRRIRVSSARCRPSHLPWLTLSHCPINTTNLFTLLLLPVSPILISGHSPYIFSFSNT